MIGARSAACASSASASVKRERERHQRARRPAVAADPREQRRRDPQGERSRDHDEPDRDECDLGDADGRHAAFGDDTRDDREDDQTDHVVGDRGTEHGARFDRCERAEVAEHPRSDADARRRQCRADEQCFLTVEAEADARTEARHHRDDHADDCDEEGRAPDGTQIPQVHLEADLEEQQDHAELGEDVQHLVGLDDPEQRRPDEHSGDDLGDDRREADAIRDLGSDLRRDDHDQDVEQYRVDVHWRPLP